MTPSSPTILLEEPEIRLEEEELVVPGWRFKLPEIESAEIQRVATAATGPILMIAVGAICLLSVAGEGGVARAMLGIGLLIAAAAWWSQKKPFFKVCLRTARGEATAFESPDEKVAARVLATIEAALGSEQST
ncbi:MAG: DUF6232 family protein [Myxococcota bacterium]